MLKRSNRFQFFFIRFYIIPEIWLVGLNKTFKSEWILNALDIRMDAGCVLNGSIFISVIRNTCYSCSFFLFWNKKAFLKECSCAGFIHHFFPFSLKYSILDIFLSFSLFTFFFKQPVKCIWHKAHPVYTAILPS